MTTTKARRLPVRIAGVDPSRRIAVRDPGPSRRDVAACHFSERLPRLRDHMIAKAARVPFEDEKFAYLAVSRQPIPRPEPAARIVGPPKRSKAGRSARVCSDGTLCTLEVERRDARYKRVAKTRWATRSNLPIRTRAEWPCVVAIKLPAARSPEWRGPFRDVPA